VLGLIGEICLHYDQSIPPSVPRATRYLTHQLLERGSVAEPTVAAHDGEWNHFGIWLERFARIISAAIVVDDEFVLARIVLKHPSNAPQEHTNSLTFVVGRNADIDQATSVALGTMLRPILTRD
jgi:hypothetical protein